jgi:hypothetical protein
VKGDGSTKNVLPPQFGKSLRQVMRNSPNGAQFLDAAQEQLALWKKESTDRAGIHVFEPSLARA